MLPVGVASLIVALGVCWAVTPLIVRLGHALNAVDLPGARKIHRHPIPRIGGLAVFLGFVAGLMFAAWATGTLWSVPEVSVYWRGLAYAATAMLLMGLADDLWGLSFYTKFATQIAASCYVWSCGFRIELISHPLGGTEQVLEGLSLPLTVLWIVGITNAVNLIDGLDGLAAGIALITTLTAAFVAFTLGSLGVTATCVALAGSLIGFLFHNFNPARIFLGDSGSMFLGFVLAVISVRGSQKGTTVVAVLVPLLMLGVPLLDTSLAVARRFRRLQQEGRNTDHAFAYLMRNLGQIFRPDRKHIHHRLLDLGLSQRRAAGVLYGLGALFASAAFAVVFMNSHRVASMLIAVLAILMATFLVLLYFRAVRASRGALFRDETDPAATSDPVLRQSVTPGEARGS